MQHTDKKLYSFKFSRRTIILLDRLCMHAAAQFSLWDNTGHVSRTSVIRHLIEDRAKAIETNATESTTETHKKPHTRPKGKACKPKKSTSTPGKKPARTAS